MDSVFQASSKFQILVVDDEQDLCAITKEYLDLTGEMEVSTSSSVIEARICLANKRYDAIVSDYQMADEDGIQFLKTLRGGGDRTPFILFTGKGREEIVIEALNNGADAYLQKGGMTTPLYAELSHHIRTAVRRHKTEECLRRQNDALKAVNEQLAAAQEEMRSQLEAIVMGQHQLGKEMAFSESLMDSLPGIFYLYDAHTLKMVRWNMTHQEVSGYSEEEMFGRHVLSWHLPENSEAVLAAIDDCMVNGHSVVEAPLVMKDGQQVPYLLTGRRLETMDGSFFMGLGIDIRERKIAEESLKESEVMHRAILDSAGLGLGFWDLEGRLILMNSIAAGQINGKPDEFIGRNIVELFGEEAGRTFMERMRSSVDSKMVNEYEDRVILSGHEMWFLSVYTYVQGPTRKESGVLIFSHDITERKRMEEELHLANSKLNLLSSITRHDINNQLIGLTSHLKLLEGKLGNVTYGNHLVMAMAAVERISTMIHFTKDSENIGLNIPCWQEVRSTVERSVKDVQLGSINLQNDIPVGLEVFADPLIVKVFYNLIDNAVRHGGRTTTIRFYMEDIGGDSRIVCQDDGAGIPPEMKKTIFLRGSGKDHGFGLFLSHEILAISNIWISEDGKLGRGARFVMKIHPAGTRNC